MVAVPWDRKQKAERRRELEKMPKEDLVQLHMQYGGAMGAATYRRWHKEELINTILEDEFDRVVL
jgi:hypothetical protein